MGEQATALWLLVLAGMVNGVGQVIMRWGGKAATVPFSTHNLVTWLIASKWWLLGLVFTWTSGLFWALLLKKVQLVVALPLFAGTSYLVTILAAVVLLAERPNPYQIMGMFLVMGGVGLIITHP